MDCCGCHCDIYLYFHSWTEFIPSSYGLNIGGGEDADTAVTLSQPPPVLLLVVDVDDVPVADGQLVVHAGSVIIDGAALSYHSHLLLLIVYFMDFIVLASV